MTARPMPPGPTGHWLWGTFTDFRTRRLAFLRELTGYGGLASVRFGPFPVFMANSPEMIHQVLVADASKYYKTQVTKKVLASTVGNGLFVNDGESWKRQRRLAQPAFHTRRISSYADTMVQLASAMADRWQAGVPVAMHHAMPELTMQIITRTMFGGSVGANFADIGSEISRLLEIIMARFDRLYMIPEWLPTRENRTLKRIVARLDQLILGFIEERRASGEDRGDLLAMLLLAQDEDGSGGMTDRQVRDECLITFGAGHETTANALVWTWYALSQHPDIEARLHEELDTVLGGRAPTLEDLPSLKYTEMVLKEAMRLYPPAWGTTREPVEDVTLGGYTVKKGETVFVNIYGVHMDPQYFPDPERFDPERFSPEAEKSIPKYAYLPFGGGPRVCIGNAFAMMEAKLILATMGQRFSLRVAPGQQVVPETVFTLRARHGLSMIPQARESVRAQAAVPVPVMG
jgi:cytochrome P450